MNTSTTNIISPKPEPDLRSSLELRDAVLGLLTDKPKALNWNGHWRKGKQWKSVVKRGKQYKRNATKQLLRNLGFIDNGTCTPSEQDALIVIEAIQNKTAIPCTTGNGGWISICSTNNDYGCPHCEHGQDLTLETNGLVVRARERCPTPDGLVSTVTLNIPSGKLIVADDIRMLCPIPQEHDVNRQWGQHEMFLDYGNNGQIHGQCGNTSPDVFKCPDGTFVIGCERTDYEDAEENELAFKGKVKAEPLGVVVASVSTDLWAYSLMDFDEAERRAKAFGLNFKTILKDCDTFELEPGTYEFKHFYPDRDDDQVVYGTFKRIGPATEPFDWIAMWKNFQVTAGQAVQILAAKWPTLYGKESRMAHPLPGMGWATEPEVTAEEQWAKTCARVLHSTFNSCIPNRDWNPNGFKNDFMPNDLIGIEDKPIPHFLFRYPWDFAFSAFPTIVTGKHRSNDGVQPLNKSHAQAAAHIFESAIKYGIQTYMHGGTNTYDVAAKRKDMHLAAALWPGFITRYPAVVESMSEFAAWMLDTDQVKKWIDDFDLGPETFDRAAWNAELKVKGLADKRKQDEKLILAGCQVVVSDRSIGGPAIGAVGITEADDLTGDLISVIFPYVGRVLVPLADLDLGPDLVAKQLAELMATFEILRARFKAEDD